MTVQDAISFLSTMDPDAQLSFGVEALDRSQLIRGVLTDRTTPGTRHRWVVLDLQPCTDDELATMRQADEPGVKFSLV